MKPLWRWARLPLAQLLGAVMTVGETPLLALGAVAGRSARVSAAQRWLVRAHLARLRFARPAWNDAFSHHRAAGFLLGRWPLGVLTVAIGILLCYGAGITAAALVAWAGGDVIDGIAASPFSVGYLTVVVIVLGFLAYQGLRGTARMERRLAERFLGPDTTEALKGRIAELANSRAEVVAAVDDERRRIERDLHDGVQQRVVALGMLIGRARRTDRVALLDQAHTEAQAVLWQLREVAWRIYPSALDEAGLAAAVEAMAERSAIPVRADVHVASPAPAAVEIAAYFVASEGVTNAVKHAMASEVEIRIARVARSLTVTVRDDGRGGAEPGGGLSGLRRRVEAVDGTFVLHSPTGGPTLIAVEMPCE